MPDNIPAYATLDGWITSEAIPFALDSTESLNAAADRLMASAGSSMVLLALGEPLHGGQEFLVLRNRLFQRLVEAHGFSAIAIESSFTRAGGSRVRRRTRAGLLRGDPRRGSATALAAWRPTANLSNGCARRTPTRSHGQAAVLWCGYSPTEMTSTDSPGRRCLRARLSRCVGRQGRAPPAHRLAYQCGCGLESFEAMMDPARAVGLSPAASACALRRKTSSPSLTFAARNLSPRRLGQVRGGTAVSEGARQLQLPRRNRARSPDGSRGCGIAMR